MNNATKIILYVFIATTAINLCTTFLGDSSINNIREELIKASRVADSTLGELKNSRNRLDSLRSDILQFESVFKEMKETVDGMDKKRNREQIELANNIDRLTEKIRKTREELAIDSLPGIDIVDPRRLEKNNKP